MAETGHAGAVPFQARCRVSTEQARGGPVAPVAVERAGFDVLQRHSLGSRAEEFAQGAKLVDIDRPDGRRGDVPLTEQGREARMGADNTPCPLAAISRCAAMLPGPAA